WRVCVGDTFFIPIRPLPSSFPLSFPPFPLLPPPVVVPSATHSQRAQTEHTCQAIPSSSPSALSYLPHATSTKSKALPSHTPSCHSLPLALLPPTRSKSHSWWSFLPLRFRQGHRWRVCVGDTFFIPIRPLPSSFPLSFPPFPLLPPPVVVPSATHSQRAQTEHTCQAIPSSSPSALSSLPHATSTKSKALPSHTPSCHSLPLALLPPTRSKSHSW
ncbi:unnamed protein product, partial [Closterium sp. NIES-54]